MKRVTASEARRNWFRLLDEIVAGETVVVDRDGVRVVLRREGEARESARDVPDYEDVLRVPEADQADRWGWEWEEGGLRPREDAET
ncbi:MAG: hypothetical protein KY397_03580 [Gemmatimonadetes bacterium]|nr:hypothetical protein [Gemmatimonadota bacterium]